MHDFFCTDPDDMHYEALAEKVRYFKEDEKGIAAMCKVMEKMRSEAANEASEKTKIQLAINLIQLGKLSLEEIANAVELSIDKVRELSVLA